MNLSRAGFLEVLRAGRVNPAALNGFGTRLNGTTFATVSREFVAATFDAVMDELAANAPELVDVLDLGNGRSRRVPRYVANGFCCRGQALKVYANALTGFALKGARAALAGAPLIEDALALGVVEYFALGRPENRGRQGWHVNLFFADPDCAFQTFEQGDGEEHEFNDTELASIRFVYAQ